MKPASEPSAITAPSTDPATFQTGGCLRIVSGGGASVSDGAGGIGAEVSLTGAGAPVGAAFVAALAGAALVNTFCAMAPGSGISEFVSGWARRTCIERKISPPMHVKTVLNFPPYKDVRKIITNSM